MLIKLEIMKKIYLLFILIVSCLLLSKITQSQTITIDSITPAAPYCAGATINIYYNISGSFAGSNIFTYEISDVFGSFASPIKTGSIPDPASSTISVTIPSGTNTGNVYKIRVKSSNPVTSDTGSAFTINALPDNAGTITGLPTVCQGDSPIIYSVPVIANATSYIWTLPVGASGASTTNSISLNYSINALSGNITVKGHNNTCGDGLASTFAITVNPLPLNAGTITGTQTVCQGRNNVSYSVPSIANATSYIWTLPTGATGNSTTNTITVNYSTTAISGNIKVKGHNTCGDGTVSANYPITVNPLPGIPAAPTGNASLCKNPSNQTYSTLGGLDCDSYIWNILPSTAGIISGSSTSATVTVDWNNTYTDIATISVKGHNSCGDGLDSSSLIVIIHPLPKVGFKFSPDSVCSLSNIHFINDSLNSNPTNYIWKFGDNIIGMSTSTNPNIDHVFDSIGNNTITDNVWLISVSQFGCKDSVTHPVHIKQRPDARLKSDYPSPSLFQNYPNVPNELNATIFKKCNITPPHTLQLVNLSTTSSTNTNYWIKWGFSTPDYNSMGSSFGSPNNNYPNLGTYLLTDSVKGGNGCFSIKKYNIFIGTLPTMTSIAVVSSLPVEYDCAPQTYQFQISYSPNDSPGTTYKISTNEPIDISTLTNPLSSNPYIFNYTFNNSSCEKNDIPNQPNAFSIKVNAVNYCNLSGVESIFNPIRLNKRPQSSFTGPNSKCIDQIAEFQSNSSLGCWIDDQSPSNIYNNINNINYYWVITNNNTGISNPGVDWDVEPSYLLGNVTTFGGTPTIKVKFHVSGNYTIKLFTANYSVSVCPDETPFIQTICISPNPVSSFSINKSIFCLPDTVKFTNTTDTTKYCNIPTYTWNIYCSNNGCNTSGCSGIVYLNGTSVNSKNPIIKFTQPGIYSFSLTVNNSCGSDTSNIQTITVKDKPTIAYTVPTSVCANSTICPTSVSDSNCYGVNVSTYNWTSSNGSFTSPTSLNPDCVAATSGSSQTVTLDATNECGTTSLPKSVVINPLPSAAGVITGITPVCQGKNNVTYTVPIIANTTTYIWTLPSGASGTSTTNSIIVSFSNIASSGNITVKGSNSCGYGASSSLAITVNPLPSAAGVITGTTPVCQGQNNVTYTVPIIANATAYIWTLPSGASGTSTTNSIIVSFSNTASSGNITVKGSNSCGYGATSSLAITVNPLPSAAGVITGTTTVCQGQNNITYTVPIITNATTYIWTLPSGASGTSTTNSIIVSFSNTASSGNITVKGSNSCGYGASSSLAITVNPLPSAAGVITGITPVCQGKNNVTYTVPIIANTTTYIWTLPSGASGTSTTNSIIVSFSNIASSGNITVKGSNSCGYGAPSSLAITVNPLPTVSVNSATICYKDTVTLTASGATTYQWSPSTGLNQTTGNIVKANPLVTTTYTVTGTNSSTGCQSSTTSIVTVKSLPVVNAGLDTTLCNQPIPFTLGGYSPNGGTWTGVGLTGNIFTPSGTGLFPLVYSYTNTASAPNCSNKDTVLITVINPQIANAGTGFPICIDHSAVTLAGYTPAATSSTGTWSGSGVSTAGVFTPSTAGSGLHILTYSFGSGTCLSTDTIQVTVNPLPTVTVNSATICYKDTVTLTASGATTYQWSPSTGLNQTTGNIVKANPLVTTTYTVTGTNSSTGCQSSTTSIVTVKSLPVVNAGLDTTLCNQAIPFTLGGYSPSGGTWTGVGLTGNIFTPSGTGLFPLVYSYTNTASTPNCSNKDTVLITVINPQIANAGTGFPICIDHSAVTLAGYTPAATSSTGTWSGSGVSTAGVFTPSTAGSGLHILTYSFGSGTCLSTDTIQVTVNPLPTVTVNSATICYKDTVTLTASGATTYQWSPSTGLNQTTGNIVKANPLVTTTYTVTGTNSSTGCQSSTTSIVTVKSLPVVNAGLDTTLCNQPIPFTLGGYSPNGGTWTGVGLTGNIFTPSGTGLFPLVYSYTNTASAPNCSNKDTVLITVINPQIANAGTGFPICIDHSAVTLAGYTPAATSSTGTWSGSGVSTAGVFTPSTAGSGLHILTYSFGSGTCLSTDTIQVTVNPLPTVTVNSATICYKDTVTLTASGATTYQWSPSTGLNQTTGNIVKANPLVTTTYTVTGTNSSTGCQSSTTSIVTVKSLPVVNAGLDTTLCNQAIPFTLGGYSPSGGTWTGVGLTGNIFTPSGTGLFPLVYSYTNTASTPNCSNKDTVLITVINPQIANAGTGFPICIDHSAVTLAGYTPAATSSTGTWSGSGVSTAGVFTPSTAGSGLHILTYSFGSGTCLSTDTIQVTVNPLPTVTVNSATICYKDTVTLTASGATTYQWSPSTGLNQTTGNIVKANPLVTTTYTVTGTNSSTGCQSSTTSIVTVKSLPVVNAGLDTTLCNQAIPFTLGGYSPSGGTWTGVGLTGNIFTPSGTGLFPLVYSYTNTASTPNCSNKDTVLITVINPQIANAGTGFPICIDHSAVTLAGYTPAATSSTGTWSGSGVSTAGVFTPSTAGSGLHILTYSFGSGTCLSTDTIQVTVNPLPTVTVNSATICYKDTVTLTASGATTYQWSPSTGLNQTTGNIVKANPLVTTTYTVTGTNSSTGCQSSTTSIVTVKSLPVVNAGLDTTLCNQAIPFTLGGYSPSGGTWTGVGLTGNIFTPSGTGLFPLVYSYTNTASTPNCSNKDTVLITVINPQIANAGTGFPICIDHSAVTLAGYTPAATSSTGTWSGSGVSTAGVFTPSTAGSGLHILTYSFGSGTCLSTDTIQVTVNPLPTVTVNSATICYKDTVTLTASGATTYQWSPSTGLNQTTGNIVKANPLVTTNLYCNRNKQFNGMSKQYYINSYRKIIACCKCRIRYDLV